MTRARGRRTRTLAAATPRRPWSAAIALACVAVVASEAIAIVRNLPALREADFLALWAGARAARAGLLEAAADPVAFRTFQESLTGLKLDALHPWLYPPTTLLILWPLAFMPYRVAFAVWTSATALPYLAVLRRAFPRSRVVVLAGVASPAAFMTAVNGQTSFLAAALLGWGLLLVAERPRWSGVLLGALAIKPQLAICVPIALAAGRHWAALASAAATAAALALLATLCFGVDPWRSFVEVQSPFAWTLLQDGRFGYHKVQSAFAAVRLLGGGMTLALTVHALIAAVILATVAWIWSRRSIPHELKSAAVLSGGVGVSVYFLDYDTVSVVIAIAIVVAHALRTGWSRVEMGVVALAAVAPGISRLVGEATHVNVGAVAVLALYAVVVRRASHAEGAPAAHGGAPPVAVATT
jgi:hypothetical protein